VKVRTRPKVRVVSEGMGHRSQVFFVPDDGDEVEISHAVTGAELRLDVGDVNRALLQVIVVGSDVTAEVEQLVLQHIGPSRLGRYLWRLKKWWWVAKDREVTTLASEYRTYVDG
jgi:hypothetical protein